MFSHLLALIFGETQVARRLHDLKRFLLSRTGNASILVLSNLLPQLSVLSLEQPDLLGFILISRFEHIEVLSEHLILLLQCASFFFLKILSLASG